MTGVIWLSAVRQLVRMRRLLRRHACSSDRLTGLSRDVAERFQLRSSVSIQIVDAPVAPMLWAWPGRAAILLPRKLAETLDDDSLRSIIAHELAHLVRRDHWTNLFALVVASLFWWNPLAWFVRRRLLAASEASCDALALERLQGSRKKYAATLLMVVDSLKAAPRQCPAFGMTFGSSHSLTRRVELIADDGVRARTTRAGWIVLALAMLGSCLIPAQAEGPATPAPAPAIATGDSTLELATFCCPEVGQKDAGASNQGGAARKLQSRASRSLPRQQRPVRTTRSSCGTTPSLSVRPGRTSPSAASAISPRAPPGTSGCISPSRRPTLCWPSTSLCGTRGN